MQPTLSLELSNNELNGEATDGSIAIASTNVMVSISNAEDYSLILSVEDENLINGSTTLTAGNPGDSSKNNVWGYYFGDDTNPTTYTAPTTTGTTLTSSTNPTTGTALTNGEASFTKNLVFAARFSDTATYGHYGTSGVVSLVTTPNQVVFDGITTMQEMTPEICERAEVGDSTILKDNRTYPTTKVTDKNGTTASTAQQISNEYVIAKMPDGKCWMTQNLRLTGSDTATTPITGGTSGNSQTSGNYNIPKNDKSAFPSSDNTAQASFLGTDNAGNITGYYTWCAATAGSCSGLSSSGQHANYSICPKGWRLPGGYNDATYGNEFYTLFNNMGLGIALNTSGGTNWSSSWSTIQPIVQGSPYNFAFTGRVVGGSYNAPADHQIGRWWSSMANGSTYAYNLYIDSSDVDPGTNYNNRYHGCAVRCVAK